jgi:DNA-binding MarR family transcriptional regulator
VSDVIIATTPAPPPPTGIPDGGDVCERLGRAMVRHARTIQLLKAQMAAWAPEALDWGAFSVLAHLVRCGPRRQRELADLTLLDASTVSRHVRQLVGLGMVQRTPDPQDGRAALLAVTARGREVQAEVVRRRDAILRQLLSAWPDHDVEALAALLTRLSDDFELYRPLLASAGAADTLPPFPSDHPRQEH